VSGAVVLWIPSESGGVRATSRVGSLGLQDSVSGRRRFILGVALALLVGIAYDYRRSVGVSSPE
jgi:hypothetical protein